MHSFAGLVKANPVTTFAQVYSRLFVVWGIAEGVPGVRIPHAQEIYSNVSSLDLSVFWFAVGVDGLVSY